LLKEMAQGRPRAALADPDAGSGYAAPAVVGERLFLLGNDGLDDEYIQALAVRDGPPPVANASREGPATLTSNPSSRPRVRRPPWTGSLYALGSDGDFACVEAASRQDPLAEESADRFCGKTRHLGVRGVPVDRRRCRHLHPGGSEATLVAFNKRTGEVLWKSAVPGGDDAAYASAIVVEGRRDHPVRANAPKGLVGVERRPGDSFGATTKR